MVLIGYSQGQWLGAVLYLIFSVCRAAEPSGQKRVELRGMLWLHKRGWIAWQRAQSMNDGNSISCDHSTREWGGKSKFLAPLGRQLALPLSRPYTISWEKESSGCSYLLLLHFLLFSRIPTFKQHLHKGGHCFPSWKDICKREANGCLWSNI